MSLNQPSNNRSGSRKRRHQVHRETRPSRTASAIVRMTSLQYCVAFLLLQHSGAMGKCELAALSCHSLASSSAAFIPSQSLSGRKNNNHPNSITSQARRAQGIKSATTSSSNSNRSSKNVNTKERKSTATFVGDSTMTLELDAPMELVQEFLQSDSSNMYLLGTDDIKCHDNCPKAEDGDDDDDENQLFECKQPILEFMGLKLQPIFQHKLHRNTPNQVTASIEEGSKAEIVQHSKYPAKRVISGLVNEATFVGESVVTVHPSQQHPQQKQKRQPRLCSTTTASGNNMDDDNHQKCKLSIALSLTLQIPMPRFFPIPPGFNAIGSAIVRRTGRLRTQQLLERLRAAYFQHQQDQQQQLHVAPRTTRTKLPSISSFEENFRRLLACA